MTSWVGFNHVLADLRAEAAPEPLITLAERAVADEYRHALWCRDWAVRFGHPGGLVEPRTRRPVEFAGAPPEQNRLLRIALCAFTETVGCVLLRHIRPLIVDEELRQLNRRHLADELQHSRVGWGFLSTLGSDRMRALERALPALLAAVAEVCCSGPEQERPDLVPFGYFTPSLLRDTHAEARRGVIDPGLRHLGIRSAA